MVPPMSRPRTGSRPRRRAAEAAVVPDPSAVAEAATTLGVAFGFAAGAAASSLAEAEAALRVVASLVVAMTMAESKWQASL